MVGEESLIRVEVVGIRSWRLSLSIAVFGESRHGYDRHANKLALLAGARQSLQKCIRMIFGLSRLNQHVV